MQTVITPAVLEAERHYYGRTYPSFEDAPEPPPRFSRKPVNNRSPRSSSITSATPNSCAKPPRGKLVIYKTPPGVSNSPSHVPES